MPKAATSLTLDQAYMLKEYRKIGQNKTLGINKFVEAAKRDLARLNLTNAQIKLFLSQEAKQNQWRSPVAVSRTASKRTETISQFTDAIINDHRFKDTTKKQYVAKFTTMYKALGENTFNAVELEKYLDEKYTPINTKINYVNIASWIATALKRVERSDLNDLYNKWVDRRNAEKNADPNKKTQREEDNWINLDEFIRLKNELKDDDPMYAFVLSTFLEMPPMRSDISTVKCRNYDRNTENYYENGHLYFNSRIKKNRGRADDFDLTMMKPLFDDYIASHNDDYLIGKHLTSEAFSKYLIRRAQNHFDKNIGIQILRKVYLSNFYDVALKDVDFDLIQAVLRMCNHTLNASLGYRRN